MIQQNLPVDSEKAAHGGPLSVGSAAGPLLAPVAAIVLVSVLIAEAFTPAKAAAAEAPTLSLRASGILALKDRCGSPVPLKESYQLTREHAYSDSNFKSGKMLAFEEHRLFLYAVGEASSAGGAALGRPVDEVPRFVRRVIFLKPSTLVVDDQVHLPASLRPVRWLLHSRHAPEIVDRQVRIAAEGGELLCETLLPEGALPKATTPKSTHREDGKPPSKGGQAAHCTHLVEVVPEGRSGEVRFLHVLHARASPAEDVAARAELARKDGELRLSVSTPQGVFRLRLPPADVAAGEIEVSRADGETLLPRRPLASGILPHGPQGTRLLERWDAAYRGGRRPGWDTRRPSSNLKKVVEQGAIRPCRAVVLGCGSGTNAIYLAGKGFDVTGIDIAPTALSLAEEKARKAGVKVRWLLADVLKPPKLAPFEFIFDRGCYHGVRRQNAAGYVATVGRLSGGGTRLLILAGNANEARHYGPPRVKEEELRGDFAPSPFEFRWLREVRFDTIDPAGQGALAFSALLERRAEP